MRLTTAFLAMLASQVASVPGQATTVIPSDFKCPLGGEVFKGRFQASGYKKISDSAVGMPLGAPFVWPIEQCPNGFLIAKSRYSSAELRELSKLIARPEYRALRDHPTFEQLWWLRREQGADSYELAQLSLLAAREALFSGEGPQRLTAKYLVEIGELPFAAERSDDWFRAYLNGVNLLRQQGRFAAAQKVLSAISVEALQPNDPSLRKAAVSLNLLIEERIDSRLPVTLDNLEGAAAICLSPNRGLGQSEVVRCASLDVRRIMRDQCQLYGRRFPNDYPTCQSALFYNDIAALMSVLLAALLLSATFWQLRKSDPKRSGTHS